MYIFPVNYSLISNILDSIESVERDIWYLLRREHADKEWHM